MPRVWIVAMVIMMVATGCTQATTGGDAPAAPAMEQKATASSAHPESKVGACELLTPGEIAGFLKVTQVKKDDLNSGKNEMTKVDFCNWYVKEGSSQGIEIRLRRAESADEGSAMAVFSAAKG